MVEKGKREMKGEEYRDIYIYDQRGNG